MMRPCHKNVVFTDPTFTRYTDCHLRDDVHVLRVSPNYPRGRNWILHVGTGKNTGQRMKMTMQPGATDANVALTVEPAFYIIGEEFFDANPSLLDYDYPPMRAQMALLRRELLSHVMHPSRLHLNMHLIT
jgi:hypothetical protein